MIINVTNLQALGGHRLQLAFNDGSSGTTDMQPYLESLRSDHPLAVLRDEAIFASAAVAHGTVAWGEDLDIAAEVPYALVHGLTPPATTDEADANYETVRARRGSSVEVAAPRVELVADFIADLRKAQIAQLVSEGYNVGDLDTKDNTWVGAAWATARMQRLPRRARVVHISAELAARRDIRAELAHAVRAIRKGLNLNPFLSTRHRRCGVRREQVKSESGATVTIERPGGVDLLFAAWRIHHMHLGPPSTTRVARTNDLLFVRFEREHAYLINSYPHQSDENESPFSKQELLRIVHRNWPALLGEPTGLPLSRSGEQVSDEDMGRALRAGLTVQVTIDGKNYLPTRGLTTSTHSSDAVTAADRMIEDAYAQQQGCAARIEEIADAVAADSGGARPCTVELRFVVNGQRAHITVKPTGKKLGLVDGRVVLA